MAVPAYDHDLTDITLAESTTGYSFWGGGNIALGAGPDFSMQGTNAVDGKITNAEKGPYYDNGAGITFAAGIHAYVWAFLATPGLADTLVNRGLCINLGSASTAYCKYHVEGNETYGAIGRVGKCYPIDYSVRTSNTGASPYRTLVGSPGANPRVFGSTANITASVKGSNLAIDATRYGTGAFLTAGELISAGDGSDNPCTFAGFQDLNDAIGSRWGILTLVSGSFELQGVFAIGQNNTGIATLCRFNDSDKNIIIPDTVHSSADFSNFLIDHANTRVEWDNINIEALGTRNRGKLDVNATNPTVLITGGTWKNFGTSVFRSNSVLTNMSWQLSGLITSNGASFVDCTFDRTSAASAISVATLADIDGGSFISDGSSHGAELTGAAATYSWTSIAEGYDVGSSGTGVQVTGGSITGNETIHITAVTGTFIIAVASGATIPSVSSAGAIVNVVLNSVTTLISVINTALAPVQNARVYIETELGGDLAAGVVIISGTTDSNGQISDTRAFTSDQPISGRVRKSSASPFYKTSAIVGTISSASGIAITTVMILDQPQDGVMVPLFTDDFNRANETDVITTSAAWDRLRGNREIQLVGNVIDYTAGSGNFGYGMSVSPSVAVFDDDQWAEATFPNIEAVTNCYQAVGVRCAFTGSDPDGYFAWSVNGAGDQWRAVGFGSNLVSFVNTGVLAQDGDTVRLEVRTISSTEVEIQIFINGVHAGTGIDTRAIRYLSGVPGVQKYSKDATTMDNYKAGNL